MKKSNFIYYLTAVLICLSVNVLAQNNGKTVDRKSSDTGFDKSKINQVDSQGQKHGFWTRKYKNGQVAYEVYFNHGKPVGEHKRYTENGTMYAHLIFDNKGYAKAKLYNDNGKLGATGFYFDKKRDSTWIFFSKNGDMIAKESYKKGVRHGYSRKYFDNGNVLEENRYIDGVEDGIWKQYYEDGTPRLEGRVSDGKLHGYYLQYKPTGALYIRGKHKDGLKDGIWKYNTIRGKKQIEYIAGEPTNKNVLDSLEQNEFQRLEQNADKERERLRKDLRETLGKWGLPSDQYVKDPPKGVGY